MPGYATPTKRLTFPELQSGPDDPIWVVIKNPKIQPIQALQPSGIDLEAAGENGEGLRLSNQQAIQAGREVAARLVIAWRVYDATVTPQFDPLTGDEINGTGPQLLGPPQGGNGVHPDEFAKLPMRIVTAIMQEITAAVNPQPAPAAAGSTPTGS